MESTQLHPQIKKRCLHGLFSLANEAFPWCSHQKNFFKTYTNTYIEIHHIAGIQLGEIESSHR